jgi:DNA-binding SARP family transcriptional activator
VDKLKGAAESYVVLEDYTAAIPLLTRLLEIQPSVENAGNLADVYAANGKRLKAAEVYRDAVNAEVSFFLFLFLFLLVWAI